MPRRRATVAIALFALLLMVGVTMGLTHGSPGASALAGPRIAAPGATVQAGRSSGSPGRAVGNGVIVGHAVAHARIQPLRALPPVAMRIRPEHEVRRNPAVATKHRAADDPVVQSRLARPNMPLPTLNFDGIAVSPGGGCTCAPPDTNDECIAVSTSSDATGSYNTYDFHLGSDFFDYPKFGVWPDASYMSMNVFNSAGTAFLRVQPFAFDRAAMLAGNPSPAFVTFRSSPFFSPAADPFMPADVDGPNLPPAGAPNPFLTEGIGSASWPLYRFHVDFATPPNSTFTLAANL